MGAEWCWCSGGRGVQILSVSGDNEMLCSPTMKCEAE